MAQIIALEMIVSVARVINPVESVLLRVSLNLLAAEIKQRPQQHALPQRTTACNRTQAGAARAAHQIQQHGFCLIVLVVRCQQRIAGAQGIGKKLIAQQAGARFKIGLPGIHVQAINTKFQAVLLRLPAHKLLGFIGVYLQAVIDMPDDEAGMIKVSLQRMQQHRRIDAAAAGDIKCVEFGGNVQRERRVHQPSI